MLSYEKLDVYRKAFSIHSEVFRSLKNNNELPLSMMLNIEEGSGGFTPGAADNLFDCQKLSIRMCCRDQRNDAEAGSDLCGGS